MPIISRVTHEQTDNLDSLTFESPMVEFPEKDFKPFYQDLKIKPRYLQGAYTHQIKISKFCCFWRNFFKKKNLILAT